MHTLLQPALKRFLIVQLLPLCLLFFLCLLLVTSLGGQRASAKGITVTNNDNLHFSQQVRLGFHSGADWEPSLTADSFGHIYAMYKHYDVNGGQTCAACNLRMVFQRSNDNGRTWSSPTAIAPIPFKGKSGQDDPQIVVDPVDGRTVWASFMVSYPKAFIAVTKSTDFGETWSSPIEVSPQPPNFDKDELIVKGKTVAVAYDDGFNTWVSISLDGGKHWAVHEIFPGSSQFYMSLSAGGAIDSHGILFFSWNSFDKVHSKKGDGPVTLWVSRSTDNGLHWTGTVFGKSGAPFPCHPCGFAYLSAQDALKIGDYFQMSVDHENQTQIAWGEGPSYAGPGNQWTSHSADY